MESKSWQFEVEQLGSAWIVRTGEKGIAAGTLKQAIDGLRMWLAAQTGKADA